MLNIVGRFQTNRFLINNTRNYWNCISIWLVTSVPPRIYSNLAKMSASRNKCNSVWSSNCTLVPPNSGRRTVSPALIASGTCWPDLLRAPGPTATTVPSKTLAADFSGRRMPPLLLVTASARRMRTRSNSGMRRFATPDCK